MNISKKDNFSILSISFVVLAVFIFLSEWIQKIGFINFPSGLRHILILFLFIFNWFFFGRKIKISRHYLLFLIFLFFYLNLAFYFSNASLVSYILGVLFTFLYLIIFILASNTRSSINTIINIFNSLLIFVILMSILPISQGIVEKSTLRWLPGLFREVGAFGSAMNTATILSLSLFIITQKKKYVYFAIFLSFGVLMTILKKTMISNVIVWLFFFFYLLKSELKPKMIIYSLIFIFLAIIIYGKDLLSNIEENQLYIDNAGIDGHVRIGMYLASFNIIKDFFPFGSGLGTFGSLASIAVGYSNVYYDYGVADIGRNSAEDVLNGHHTLLDTFWPHIVGELGIIGTILFLYFWLYPVFKSFKFLKISSNPFLKSISFFVVSMIITISWEGFSLYTPEVPIFIMLNSGLGGLCYFHIKSQNELH